MSSAMKGIIAGILSGLVFVVFYLFLHVPFLFSVVIGIAAYAGIFLICNSPTLYGVEVKGMDETQIELLKKTIDEGYDKLNEIKNISKEIKKNSIRSKIDEICLIADKIFEYLRKNPKSVSNIRRFLNYYLDAMINIITKYVDISRQEVDSRNIEYSLQKAERLLDTVKKAFTVQQEKLLTNDMIELDTEIELFEDTMKSEDLGDEKR